MRAYRALRPLFVLNPKTSSHKVVQRLNHQARRRFTSAPSSSPLTTRHHALHKPSKAVARYISSATPFRPSLLGRTARQTRNRPQHRANNNKASSQPSESSAPSPNPTPNLNSPDSSSLTLSQRMRKLSREYGWSALGVYLGLSALDFPFCFAGVRLLGVERIGHYEQVIVSTFWNVVSYPFPEGPFGKHPAGDAAVNSSSDAILVAVPAQDESGAGQVAEPGKPSEWTWGVEEAQKANKDGATIWTQLALAYAIHKSFIFLRVPLTAAITPKVVRVLRGWGWDIGKRKPKVHS